MAALRSSRGGHPGGHARPDALRSVTAIQGAAGYAWFVGAAGAEKLEKITTINSATFAAPLIGGAQQAATTVGAADYSANATGFNGLLTTALKSGSGAYVNRWQPARPAPARFSRLPAAAR
jgi:hypothetical protein